MLAEEQVGCHLRGESSSLSPSIDLCGLVCSSLSSSLFPYSARQISLPLIMFPTRAGTCTSVSHSTCTCFV
jgi:hypothetical protein